MEINFKISRDEENWKITFDKDSWGILNWSSEPYAWNAFWQTLSSCKFLTEARQ